MVVFLLSGLWHGADWKFVVWGAIHGLALLTERGASRIGFSFERLLGPFAAIIVRAAATFVFVCVGWVFFRASSLADAWYILTHLTSLPPGPLGLRAGFRDADDFVVALVGIAVLFTVDVFEARRGISVALVATPRPLRWAIYYGAMIGVVWFGVWGRKEFIYFQF